MTQSALLWSLHSNNRQPDSHTNHGQGSTVTSAERETPNPRTPWSRKEVRGLGEVSLSYGTCAEIWTDCSWEAQRSAWSGARGKQGAREEFTVVGDGRVKMEADQVVKYLGLGETA